LVKKSLIELIKFQKIKIIFKRAAKISHSFKKTTHYQCIFFVDPRLRGDDMESRFYTQYQKTLQKKFLKLALLLLDENPPGIADFFTQPNCL
jgi:hypothetical protein